jgi:hypothetical protein
MDVLETKGLFLLTLAISGNFIAETLSCKTQKLLLENMLAKHFISFFILFYSMSIFDDEPEDPKDTFIKTVKIYIGFILFTKMNLTFIIIVFLLLALHYILELYIDYYNFNNNSNDIIKKLKKIKNYINTMVSILIIVGFSLYLKKQYNDNYKNWSTIKFIFGVKNCKSFKLN